MTPLKPIPGRINRNVHNYMETVPFFVVAALYISGIPPTRSLFWNVAASGMLAILAAPLLVVR
jgi:uncharacterized MAPEG superfamily protein